MKKRVLIGLLVGVTAVLMVWALAAQAQVGEVLYLADSAQTNDNTSHIYRVDLSEGQANLTLVVTLGPGAAGEGDPGWNNVDVLAATPDGQYLYFIDNSASLPDTNRLGRYDVANDSVEVLADPLVSGDDFNTDQGTIAPDGTFFITRNENESLYYVDLGETPPTVLIGPIVDVDTNSTINVQGGDIAFGADGTLYIVTNTPTAVYALTVPESTGTVYAEKLGSPGNVPFSGLAVRANGLGDLVGSEPQREQITVLDKTNGSAVESFPTYLGGSRFYLNNGDMTVGPLMLCTRTIGYWKNHSWDNATVTICGVPVDETLGKEILWGARGNNFSMLFAQMIAAKLNCNTCGVTSEQWLCAQPDITTNGTLNWNKTFDSKQQKREAAGYWEALDEFNNQYECE